MTMVCYGDMPIEKKCETCFGTGYSTDQLEMLEEEADEQKAEDLREYWATRL